jgi:transglutaminase-like putative cysteine protease
VKVGGLNRRNAARLLLLGWAGALAWLANREFGKDEALEIAEATIRLSPEAHFFAVKAGRFQIGYASLTIDTAPAGFKVTEVLALDVPEADSVRRVTRRTDLALSRSLRLQGFERTVTGGGLYEQFVGQVQGDTVLSMSKRDGRDQPATTWTLRLPGDIVLPQVLPYRLAFGKRLEVGRVVEANVFDMNTGTIDRVSFAATAESTFVVADSAVEQRLTKLWMPIAFDTVKAYRIEHQATGTPVVTWVDEHGGMVRSEASLGVRLERSAFELVSFNYRQAVLRQGPDHHRSVTGMQTALEARATPDPAAAADYRVVHEPIERFLLPRVSWLGGDRQTATEDGRVQVGIAKATADSSRSEYLDPIGARPTIDTMVVRLASEVAPRGSPRERVLALTRWLGREIARDPLPSAPVAAPKVLLTRRASAEGHAATLVAMAEALGLGARIVGGVLLQNGKVYGHTWAEVELDGAWVPADPAFGQFPASRQLLRVVVGGRGRPIDMVPLLGSATFEPARAQ